MTERGIAAHRAGLKVNYSTADIKVESSELFRLGVDLPMLDDPNLGVGFADRASN